MGKGWAKGLTAATDARVAAMAEAHRGKRYVRRKPLEECRWTGGSWTTLPLEWSAAMAYVVGLTAADGCLLSGRRQINFKSKDRQLVQCYLELLGRTNAIHERRTPNGGVFFVTQFGDADLYDWLMRIGLSPRKSLTLGAIDVPDVFVLPLARGLLDGDGSVLSKTTRADTKRRTDYYWEYLLTLFTSASTPHLEWLAGRLEAIAGVRGYLSQINRRATLAGRAPFFQLRYGKQASLLLLPLLYPADAPCLERKRRVWLDYVQRHSIDGCVPE